MVSDMQMLTQEMTVISQIFSKLHDTRLTVEKLKKKFDVSSVGSVDFALESLGAEIESIGSTKTVNELWFTFEQPRNGPRNILNPSLYPGDCFGFQGDQGEVTIKLMGKVSVIAVGIMHISKEQSPSLTLENAPGSFTVYGLKYPKDPDPHEFGQFFYDIGKKNNLQTFLVKPADEGFMYIRFVFWSNHGGAQTCVYRTLVHGILN